MLRDLNNESHGSEPSPDVFVCLFIVVLRLCSPSWSCVPPHLLRSANLMPGIDPVLYSTRNCLACDALRVDQEMSLPERCFPGVSPPARGLPLLPLLRE